MSCDKGGQCVNLFFFENGVACTPERIRKRRCDTERVIIKKGKTFSYKGKALYTLQGEPVCCFNPMTLPPNVAYVLVPNCETFMCRDYETSFQRALAERKAQSRCQSLPAVPSGGSDCCPPPKKDSCCPPPKPDPCCTPKAKPCPPKNPCAQKTVCGQSQEEESECESSCSIAQPVLTPCGQSPCAQSRPSFGSNIQQRSGGCGGGCPKQRSKPRMSSDCEKRPSCQLEDSDDCAECQNLPRINYKCKSRKPPTPMVLKRKTGFFVTCCPCCTSKYKCEKREDRPVTSGCSPNAKLTQTTKEDFKVARKRLQTEIKEERQRQSHYTRKRRSQCKQRRDICPPTDDEYDEDPKTIMRREKAREKYCMKRRKMEQKLTKTLEKQYKTCG